MSHILRFTPAATVVALFIAGHSHAQFSFFSGDITLDGSPTSPMSSYTGTLGFGASLFTSAQAGTSNGANINHIGDLEIATGDFSIAGLDIAGANTVWTTSGNLRFATGTAADGSLFVSNGATVNIGGDATVGDLDASPEFNFAVVNSTINIGGDLTFENDFGNSEFVLNNSVASIGNISVKGVDTSFFVVFGSAVEAGELRVDGSNLFVESISGELTTLKTTDAFIDADGAQAFIQGDGALWQTDSLTVDGFSEVRITNGAAVSIADSLTLMPNAFSVSINSGSTLEAGSIAGDISKLNFQNGTLRLGTGLTIDDSFAQNSGFRSIDSTSALEVDGPLDAQASIVVDGLLKANSLDPSQFANITGTGTFELNTIEITQGQDLIAGDQIASPGLTLNFTNAINNGRLGNEFFEGFDGDIANGVTGEIILDEGTRLQLTHGENAGELNLLGRAVPGGDVRIESSGAFNNLPSGRIFAREADFRFDGGLNNEGILGYSFGSSSILGDVVNTGLITITGDTQVTLFDDLENNGTINLAAGNLSGGAVTVFGTYSGAGDVTGGGDLFLLGDVQIGNSPAAVTIDASLTIGPTSNTLIEISDLALGTFDRADVSGDLTLGGVLDVEFINGYSLEKHAEFEIFAFGGQRFGEFFGLSEGATVGTFNGVDLFITYDNGRGGVSLYAVPTPGASSLLIIACAVSARRRRG